MNNTWLQYAPTANKFKQTYVRGFMDISGNTIIRNGGLNIVNGNINIGTNLDVNANGRIKGNLTTDHTIYAGSIDISNSVSGPGLVVRQFANQPIATFYSDNAIMVSINDSGDVSMNRNLNVGGNLYLSGSSYAFGITKSMVGLGSADNTSDANKPVSTAQQTALDLKSNLASPTFTGTVTAPATSITNTTVATSTSSGALQIAGGVGIGGNLYVGGTTVGITSTMVGLGNVTNTSDANKPVSTAQQTALDLKSNLASPTFTGTVNVPTMSITNTTISTSNSSGALVVSGGAGIGGSVNIGGNTHIVGALTVDGSLNITGNVIRTDIYQKVQISEQVDISNSGTGPGLTVRQYGSATIAEFFDDATSIMIIKDGGDISMNRNLQVGGTTHIKASNVSTSTSSGALQVVGGAGIGGNLYVGGTTVGITSTMVGLGNVTNTSDANKPVSTAQQTALDLKANLASPTFTGTVAGITSTMVGLGNVTNTSDANKPVSTAHQTALDLKANLASPTFTGTVAGITSTMVGLGNVTNTSDANKPVSTAQQTALDLKSNLASPTFTGTVTAPATSITNTTVSTSTTTGALVVAGGAGIGGDVYIGGNIFLQTGNNIYSGNTILSRGVVGVEPMSVTTLTATGTIVTTNTTASTSTSTGALVVAGGAGIGGKVYIGDGLNVVGTVTLPASCITSSNIVDGTIMDADINASAAIAQSKIATLTTDLAAKIDTTTNQSIISGIKTFATGTTLSIAAGAALSVEGTVTLPASCITTSNIADGTIMDSDINASAAIAQSKISTLTTDLAAKAPLASPTFTGTVTTPATSITNTTVSTSTSSGALQVAGGAGIGGNVYVGGNIFLGTGKTVYVNNVALSGGGGNTTTTVDFTNATLFATDSFYAIEIINATEISSSVYLPISFIITGESLGATAGIYNDVTLDGKIRPPGSTDHPLYYNFSQTSSSSSESRFYKIYYGRAVNYNNMVVYARGGYKYFINTNGTIGYYPSTGNTAGTNTISGTSSITIESPHPSTDSYTKTNTLTFVGATSMSIVFNSLSSLQTNNYVRFYSDAGYTTLLASYNGTAGTLPGQGSNAPLVLNYETVYVKFTTYIFSYTYGFNLTATATVNGGLPAGFKSDGTLATNMTGSTKIISGISSLDLSDPIYANKTFTSNDIAITNTTVSSSVSTGALVVAGGVGIGGNVYMGSTANIAGNVNVGGRIIMENTSTNTAFGYSALHLFLGTYNTAFGYLALTSNFSGGNNTAFGYSALNANDGSQNTAVGYLALTSNSSGWFNTAVGYSAGSNNTGVGFNTYIGYNANTSLNTTGMSTAIGYNASITESNQIVLGTATEYVKIVGTKASTSTSTGALVVVGGAGIGGNAYIGGVQVSNLAGTGTRSVYSTAAGYLTNTSSDVSLKTNIEPIDATQTHLKILQLQPKTYQWIDTEKYGTGTEIGLIAQEVIEHIPELVWTGNDDKYGLNYDRIPTLLLQSIKELQRQIDELKAEIAIIKSNPM